MLSHFASKKVVCCASWAITKNVYMLDVRIGGFEMAENLLHKHVNGILSVVQVIRNNDHALTFQCVMLDPSMSFEKSSLAMVPMRGLDSHWLAMVCLVQTVCNYITNLQKYVLTHPVHS